MKKINTTSFTITLLFSVSILFAQSDAARQQIIKQVDQEAAKIGEIELNKIVQEKDERVHEYSITNNVPIRSYDYEGNLIVLDDVDSFGNPVYISTYNFSGILTIGADKLYPNGSTGANVTGNGIEAGIWDGGYTRQTHQDLVGRVTYGETGATISGHGTHVGGTIIGDGTGGTVLRGVAYEGSLLSYDFDNDVNEMRSQANLGMLVSNHSYGRQLQGNVDLILGKYDQTARGFDLLCWLNPFYLPVVSAGNDRNDGFNNLDQGYDLLTDRALSKNVLTVGAVEQAIVYTSPSSVVMSDFSSWGPTDDGRIKPDLVAKGVSVRSTEGSSDTAYGTRQGTSMSSPMVTGGIMLLHELYNQLSSSFMQAATVRGLVLITTKEAGANDGPDYKFGWGLMDVEAAGNLLINNNNSALIDERSLNTGNSYTRTVTSNQTRLKVAISWTDFAGDVNNNGEDDPTPVLINDLDIKLTDSNGVDYFPWKLDPANFRAAATKGVNDVDNIEIVEILAPVGTYTITVDHKGSLFNGSQDYTLLIDGADTGTLSTNSQILDSVKIYPNPASNYVNVALNGQLTGTDLNVVIHDILGKQVLSESFKNSGTVDHRIDLATLESGIYIIKVSDGIASTTKKLIVR
ncbi:MAG: S8 family serine peptidase [Nonlabens sp.]